MTVREIRRRKLALLVRTRAVLRMAGEDSWAAVSDIALRAEELGWDGLLIPEHHDPDDEYCGDPLMACLHAAGSTSRMAVGPGVLPLGLYGERIEVDLRLFEELLGPRAWFGIGAGFWQVDFDGTATPGPASWTRIRQLVRRLTDAGVAAERVLLGVHRHRNLEWAGAHGVGALLGGIWSSRGDVESRIAAYQSGRQNRATPGALALIVGATPTGTRRASDPRDDVPAPVRDSGWWLSGPEDLDSLPEVVDTVVVAPYADGEGNLDDLLVRFGDRQGGART